MTSAKPFSSTIFAATQAAFCMAVAWFVATHSTGVHEPPDYSQNPQKVIPRYDDARVISDAQLSAVLDKLVPPARNSRPKVNHVDHALRFWGADAEFSDPGILSGNELREFLTDDRFFHQLAGSDARSLMVMESDGIIFRTQQGRDSSSHTDHTLSTLAEAGMGLDDPLITANGLATLDGAFRRALRRFHLNQPEYEWSVLTFALYGVSDDDWVSFEGRQLTWDRIADRLMRQFPGQGCCYGGHRLFTLAAILQLDELPDRDRMLSAEKRAEIEQHLFDATRRLVNNQTADGAFDGAWPGRPILHDDKLSPLAARLLSTGHALEWWAIAPESVQPPRATIVRAGQWLTNRILQLTDRQVKNNYTFLTHAGRALSLWRGVEPAEFYRGSSERIRRLSERAKHDSR